jgi:hypothetical protein
MAKRETVKGPNYDNKGNKRRGKGLGGKGHVQVDIGMMQSPAWQSLSGNAVKVFLAMATKHWAYNGALVFSVGQAGKVLGLTPSTGSRALRELKERGFIVEEATASFGSTGRLAKEWRLTPFPVQRGGKIQCPASRDYQAWRPPKPKPERPEKKQIGHATCATVCVTGANNPSVIKVIEALRVTCAT